MASAISAFNATVFAVVYGAPLLRFTGAALPVVTNQSVNFLYSTDQLATPSTPLGPNYDTIYSEGVYDLSQNDLVITVPQVDADRYFNIALFDTFGDQFGSLGTVTQTAPGEYIMRLPHGHGEVGVQYGTVSSTTYNSKYKGEVVSPTTFGRVVGRVLVKNNESDLAVAQNLIQQANLSTVSRPSERKPLSTLILQDISTNETTLLEGLDMIANLDDLDIIPTLALVMTILQLTATFAPENPPWNISSSESEMVYCQLAAAGIRNGSYTPIPGINLTQVAEASIAAITQASSTSYVLLNNGWLRNFPQGSYGSNFGERALIAVSADLEQTIDQALYAEDKEIDPAQITPSDSYLFTFSSKPPILTTGFWSLTLYLPNAHLFANFLNRYSLGDRSNLTYPDGSPVYEGSNSSSTDEPFQILVQSIATPPPANWTSNWLPAPSVATNVTLTLRLYAPTEAMINGSWEFPIINKIAAIPGQ